MYFPNYSSSNDIAQNDDLHKVCDGEINGNAKKMYDEKIAELKTIYAEGFLNEKELHDRAIVYFGCLKNESDAKIYAEAIEGFTNIENELTTKQSVENLEKIVINQFYHAIMILIN